jgi:hypothetical protein
MALAAALFVGWSSLAVAQSPLADTSATNTGGYLVFPKLLVHTTGAPGVNALSPGELAVDTLIQLTNTSSELVSVNCYYINANGHCGGPGPGAQVCNDDSECPDPQLCVPGWSQDNFEVTLTPNQPIAWMASTGYPDGVPCENEDCGIPPNRSDGAVDGVRENPFVGELKCIQVEGIAETPQASNDLKGEATIVRSNAWEMGVPGVVLASSYNAVSFIADTAPGGPGPLCLGGTTPPGSMPPAGATGGSCAATYSPCPGTLIMQHYFDGASTSNGVVSSELTLVPCSQDLSLGSLVDGVPPLEVTAQMLVYNEFEQRFSTNSRVQCFENTRLVDIDTRPGAAGDDFSIFSIGVQGTDGANTRIRSVDGGDTGFGYGLLGVVESFYAPDAGADPDSSTAHHLNMVGDAEIVDAVYRFSAP